MLGKVLNKSFEEIKNNLKDYENKLEFPKRPEGYKKEGYVYDENQSVKWNREHRLELEKDYSDKLTEYQKESSNLELQFKHDLIRSSEKVYGINYKQGEIIYNQAWDQGHSYGYSQVVDDMITLLDFYKDVADAQ